jgi:DNA-binding NarL/FixJ family response regulator
MVRGSPVNGYKNKMISALVVHQSKLIAQVIASVLSEEPDIHIIGTANTLEEALAKLETSPCNMVVAGPGLPSGGLVTLTESITVSYPKTKVLIIGVPDAEDIILQYVMAGASGYVLEDETTDELVENLRAAHEEKALVSPSMAALLIEQLSRLARVAAQNELDPGVLGELTTREKEVLRLIGQGLTNQEIAHRLHITIGTVKNHIHNMLQKLDVSSREEAAGYLEFLDNDDTIS